MAYSKRNPNIGGNPGNPVYGAFGGGSTQSINPHGLQTNVLNFLSSLNPPQVTPPKKASVLNIPNAYNVLSDVYRAYSMDRLSGKTLRRSQRIWGQGITDAEEDLRKRKILFRESRAGAGMALTRREGKSEADWMFETRQKNIDLSRARQYEEKSRWKRQRLHRILFG